MSTSKDEGGVTALMMASEDGDLDVVRTLLAKGADVNSKDEDGVTALIMAFEGGHLDIARTLLAKGADVNSKDKRGVTALMMASGGGHLDVVRTLLAKGADVNSKDEDGVTALMMASAQGRLDVALALLAKGADVDAEEAYGVTAIGLAQHRGYTEVSTLLLKARRRQVSFAKRVFGGGNALEVDEASRQKFQEIVGRARIYSEGSLALTYGHPGGAYGGAHAPREMLASGRGSSSQLWDWVSVTLRKDFHDAARRFAIEMQKGHHFYPDRDGRYGAAVGSLKREADFWVLRIGPDDYEWVLMEVQLRRAGVPH